MIDLAIVLSFVLYGVHAGWRQRRRASRSLEEYFLAGRSLKGWRAGTSMAATQYAADTPLLVAGLVALGGLYAVWRLWIYGLAFLLMGFLLAAAWRRAGVLTDAELCELRYGGRAAVWLRALKALYYGTLVNCVVMAFVLVAATRIFEVFLPWHLWLPPEAWAVARAAVEATGLDLASGSGTLPPPIASTNNALSILLTLAFVAVYSTTGGLRSVVATDVGQFVFMVLGTGIYAYFALRAAGGHGAMLGALADRYGEARAEAMLSLAPPSGEALLPLLAILGLQWLFQMNSDGTGYLAQRTMACASDREARIAAIVFSLLQVVVRSLLWLPIVIALPVLFPFDPAAAPNEALAVQREASFVIGMDELLPAGARGLMLTAMLAALASTLDTHLNWGASYWSNDLYKGLWVERLRGREADPRALVRVARLSNLVVLAIALAIVGHLGSIRQGWQISLLFGAGAGAVLLLRWLWERINLWCEVAAIAVSLVLAPLLLVQVAEEWLRLALMAAGSTAAVIAAALLAPPTDSERLVGFFRRVQPPGWWPRTARAAGVPPAAPLRALGDGCLAVALAAASLYGWLIGGAGWFVQPGRWLLWLGVMVAATALAPAWLRRI